MDLSSFFEITVDKGVCVDGISEDALRQLVNSLIITPKDKDFGGVVTSTGRTVVKFNFGPDGNFAGVTARVNNKNIVLIPGANSNQLSIFKGAPSNINPGPGWFIEVELTKKYLNQPINQASWEIFFASRTMVLNT